MAIVAFNTRTNTMNDIVKPNTTSLPADYADQLMAGIAASPVMNASIGGGNPLLKMEKGSGTWVIGQANDEMQDGSRWLVNPVSFMHGWVCWVDGAAGAKNRKAGEVMGPMTRTAPPQPDPIEGKAFAAQGSFELKCMEGVDEGLQVIYRSPSQGGVEAISTLVQAFQRHFAQDRAHPCPIVVMKSTNYQHPNWGKTYKPVFEIVGWADMDGNIAGAAAAAVAPPAAAEPAKPARVRKPSLRAVGPGDPGPLKSSLQAAQTEPAPVSTQQAHIGQRRRPGR
jgi:hypothetical protein